MAASWVTERSSVAAFILLLTYTASFSSLAGRKATFLLAFILIASPVAGLRPILAARFRTWRMPKPVKRILLPFLRWRVVSVTKSPRMASACFFGTSWLSDKAAAKCLSVTVACAFAGAADFLAAAAAFFAGGMTISLDSRANLLDPVGFEQSFDTREQRWSEFPVATVRAPSRKTAQ